MQQSQEFPLDHYHRPPGWLKSHIRHLLNQVGAAAMTLATGGYSRWVAPFEVEYSVRQMPLANLAPSFEGFRLVQISDLHTGQNTPVAYLRKVIHHVKRMRYDLAVVTGDLITHGPQWVEPACDIVAELHPPVAVTFGNHDYSPTWNPSESDELACAMEKNLSARGITVLRNRALPIDRDGGRLWIVGLEDLWSGKFSPQQAFNGVDKAQPIIALSHNPDSVFALEPYGPQWVLAGHTHGGQIRIPVAGAIALPVRHKRFDLGLFQIGAANMYITRGVGFRLPVRFRCRPEVPTFILSRKSSR